MADRRSPFGDKSHISVDHQCERLAIPWHSWCVVLFCNCVAVLDAVLSLAAR